MQQSQVRGNGRKLSPESFLAMPVTFSVRAWPDPAVGSRLGITSWVTSDTQQQVKATSYQWIVRLKGNRDYCASGGNTFCGTSEKGVFLHKDCTLLVSPSCKHFNPSLLVIFICISRPESACSNPLLHSLPYSQWVILQPVFFCFMITNKI